MRPWAVLAISVSLTEMFPEKNNIVTILETLY